MSESHRSNFKCFYRLLTPITPPNRSKKYEDRNTIALGLRSTEKTKCEKDNHPYDVYEKDAE